MRYGCSRCHTHNHLIRWCDCPCHIEWASLDPERHEPIWKILVGFVSGILSAIGFVLGLHSWFGKH